MNDRFQDRGPQSSASFNKNNRDVARRLNDIETGLVDLQTRTDNLEKAYSAEAYTVGSYADALAQLSYSVGKSTDGSAFVPFCGMTMVTETGTGLPTDVDGSTVLTNPMFYDTKAGLITVGQSSVEHKLRFEPVPGTWQIHPEVLYAYALSPADHGAVVTDPKDAIDGKSLRSFIAAGTVAKALTLTYYASLPHLAVANLKSNMVTIDLAPSFHCTLKELNYTDVPNPSLAEGAHWKPFPVEASNPVGSAIRDRWQVPYNDSNIQTLVGSRRFYFPDTSITGIRTVIETKMNGTTPLPVVINDINNYMVGIRNLDVAHVNFSRVECTLVVEAKLPKTATAIDISNSGAICVNQGSDGPFDVSLEYYLLSGGTWVKYTGGACNSDTVRVKIKTSMAYGHSPALAGINFIYTPAA